MYIVYNIIITVHDSAGLLSSPLNFNGQKLHSNLAIYLTWVPPPSLDLSAIDPDIMYYEISVFNNIRGQTENSTV